MAPDSDSREFYLTAIAPRLTAFMKPPERKTLLARKEEEQRRFFEDEKEQFNNPYTRHIIENFASSIERVMAITDSESRAGREVTLEELDDVLDQIAASSSFSSASLRERVTTKHGRSIRADDLLSKVFRVLQSSETKWMIRIISKNYSPARVPETLVMSKFHFLLPDLLHFQNSIPAAVGLLGSPTIRHMPIQPAVDTCDELKEVASRELEPQAGIMTARATYEKARSIRHCCQLAGLRRMSVERKYDGEYCQIHIDLNKSGAGIKIFSKSGRDSTSDRMGIHRALRDSLELDTAGCKIKKRCILEGELLVWNEDGRIEPFHKIRRHVKRSGRFLGAARDSPVESSEHLMVMFYDILLLDDIVCGLETHDKRRRRLQSLVRRIPGQTNIGSREVIEFSSFDAAERLSETFARAITQRPFIKLKKDCIPGLGDTADFVIIGGRRDAGDEHELGIGSLWWTSFYIGCIENKDEVCRFNAKPRFRIIDTIDRHSISKENITYLNRHRYFTRAPFAKSMPEFDVLFEPTRRLQPVELFKHPFIVEVIGAGFDKPANVGYFALRFPRVLKVHEDRSFRDTISFEELQEMALRCLEIPDDGEQEEKSWLQRLRANEHLVDRSRTSSPSDDAVSVAHIGACRQSNRQQKKLGTAVESQCLDNISLGASKRKISPEVALYGNLTIKRAKQE
ncbi:ATP dependent DNA ligase domain protein [Dactylonectria estremocensis]|uniref:ATP dependent DNA ligase domain protein n=1 Tax=Dactylonectria estremocensis TaxID=1079267 RepID=A0A9P9DA19_9HYPO|nr:ATP dependent DNA ligase domain protein [Dactylonectria estremocensis]